MNAGKLAQARRLHHHVLNGGTLTPDDVSFMVAALEEAYDGEERMRDFNPDWLFPCTCGDRTAFGVVHMKDEPCYRPEERDGATGKEHMKQYKLAKVKFNNGYGALLCNKCSTIIAEGWEHEDRTHLCKKCKETKYEDNSISR